MKTIDERVVEMQFDNAQFERNIKKSLDSLSELKRGLNFDTSHKNIANLDKAIKKVSFESLARSVDAIASKFTNLGIIGVTALERLTNYALTSANRMWQAFAVAPVSTGLSEYETQINAVQTILANTESKGTTLQDVNRALDELNKYADMTIYNFTEMTRNIGTFTAAGVDLDKSVSSIKGIANLAAISGSSPLQAATAMYQLSQALASGKVTLMDWNSVVNAGMGGEVFQNALKRTARQMGKDVDRIIADAGTFRDSLTEGEWLTADVLTETLTQISGAYTEADLLAKGYTKEQAAEIYKLSQTAVDAATKVKTWTNLIDTLKEAVQSGWTTTWELIIGDFEEARDLWTGVSNTLGELIAQSADARNAVLAKGLSSGWKQFLNLGITDEMGLKDYAINTAREYGVAIDDLIEKSGSFEKSLKDGWMTADILRTSMSKLTDRVVNLSAEEQLSAGYTAEQVEQLVKLNEEIQNGTINIDEFVSKMSVNSGRENIFSGIGNIFNAFLNVVKPIKEAFRDIFPAITGDQLYAFTENFRKFTETLVVTDELSSKIKNTFKGLFSILKIITDALSVVVKSIFSVLTAILPMGSLVLDVSSKVGTYISNFYEAGTVTKVLTNALTFATSAITSFSNRLTELIDNATNFQTTSGFITSLMSGLFTMLQKIASVSGSALSRIGDSLSKVFTLDGINTITNIVTSGIIISLGNQLKELFSSISKINADFSGLFKSLKESLSAITESIRAKTLITIAAAVAILSASLVAISLVDSNKLFGAVAAMGALFLQLALASNYLSGISFKDMGKTSALIFMSTSLAILSAAFVDLASLDWDGIVRGSLALYLVSITMASTARIIGKNSGVVIKGSVGMIAMAASIKILASSMIMLKDLDGAQIRNGLISIGAMMAGLAIYSRLVSKVKISPTQSVAVMAVSTSMLILSKAVQSLGSYDEGVIMQGLLSIGLLLMGIASFINISGGSKNMISVGIGVTAIALAMDILASAIGKIGMLSPESLLVALSGIAGSLLAVALSLRFMPKNITFIGPALVVISGALCLLAGALNVLGGMSVESLLISLGALGGSLTILVTALRLMNGTVSSAASMLILAAALGVLVPSLKALGGLSVGEVVTMLASLAGVMVVLGVSATVLGPLTPAILGLSGAIALLGVAVAAIGGGLFLFATALSTLAISGVAGSAALVVAIGNILNIVPLIAVKIGETIVSIITTLGNSASVIASAFTSVGMALITSAITLIPALSGAVVTLLSSFLETVAVNMPSIINSGMSILISFLKGVRDNIYEVTVVVAEIIVQFIDGIAASIPLITTAAFDLIISFINSLGDAFHQEAPRLIEAIVGLGGDMVAGLVEGLFAGIGSIVEAAKELGRSALNAAKEFLGIASPSKEFSELGSYSAQGFSEGLEGGTSQVSSAVVVMADNSIAAIQEKLPQFKELGRTTIIEFLKGINLGEPNVKMAFKDMMNAGISTIESKIPEFETSGKEIAQGLARGITNNKSSAINAAIDLANSSKQAANDELGIASPSKEFKKTGSYVAQGFALGMISSINKIVGTSNMIRDAAINSFQRALYDAADILNYAAVTHPVTITPVVNLSKVREGAANISKILSSKTSMKMAQNAIAADGDIVAGSAGVSRAVKSGVTFIQNNYSPKALSSIDIYRNTKTQLAGMKARVK